MSYINKCYARNNNRNGIYCPHYFFICGLISVNRQTPDAVVNLTKTSCQATLWKVVNH